MPGIDRTVDIKVNADRGMMRAEIPLAGHASEHWGAGFPRPGTGGYSSYAAGSGAACPGRQSRLGSRAGTSPRADRRLCLVWAGRGSCQAGVVVPG